MPINWTEANNRILVIGKYSAVENTQYAKGEKVPQGKFYESVTPGYYQGPDPKAIQLVGLEGTEYRPGFRFMLPSEVVGRNDIDLTKFTFTSIDEDSPISKIQSEIDQANKSQSGVIKWAKKTGEEAYTAIYDALLEYHNLIASDFYEKFATALSLVIANTTKGDIGDEVTTLIQENAAACIRFLLNPEVQMDDLKIECTDKISSQEAILCFKVTLREIRGNNFRDFDDKELNPDSVFFGTREIEAFQGCMHKVRSILTNSIKMGCIPLWIISQYGEKPENVVNNAELFTAAINIADDRAASAAVRDESIGLLFDDDNASVKKNKEVFTAALTYENFDDETQRAVGSEIDQEVRALMTPPTAISRKRFMEKSLLNLAENLFSVASPAAQQLKSAAISRFRKVYNALGNKSINAILKLWKDQDEVKDEKGTTTQEARDARLLTEDELIQLYAAFDLKAETAKEDYKTVQEALEASENIDECKIDINDFISNQRGKLRQALKKHKNKTYEDDFQSKKNVFDDLKRNLKPLLPALNSLDGNCYDRRSIYGDSLVATACIRSDSPEEGEPKLANIHDRAKLIHFGYRDTVMVSVEKNATGCAVKTANDLLPPFNEAMNRISGLIGNQMYEVQVITDDKVNSEKKDRRVFNYFLSSSESEEDQKRQPEPPNDDADNLSDDEIVNKLLSEEAEEVKDDKKVPPQDASKKGNQDDSKKGNQNLATDMTLCLQKVLEDKDSKKIDLVVTKSNGEQIFVRQELEKQGESGKALSETIKKGLLDMRVFLNFQRNARTTPALISKPVETLKKLLKERKPEYLNKSLALLLADVIASFPDKVANFDEDFMAQEYAILVDAVAYGGKAPTNAWNKEDLKKIRFWEHFAISDPGELAKMAQFYRDRCKKVFELVDYVKRVRELETISNSSAELYLIDNTFEKYNEDVIITDAGANSFVGRNFHDDIPLVFISKDAGSHQTVQQAVQVFDTAIDNSQGDFDDTDKRIPSIRCLPLVFCDRSLDEKQITAPAYLDYVVLTNIPTASDYDPRTSPSVNPLLLLATSLLSSTLFEDKDNGGKVGASGKFKRQYAEWFGTAPFSGFPDAPFYIEKYLEAFKLFWSYHNDLAMKFLRNRCRNLELQFTSSYNPYGGGNWQAQKLAFKPAEKLFEKLQQEKTPLTRMIVAIGKVNEADNADQADNAAGPGTTPIPLPERGKANHANAATQKVLWKWDNVLL